MGEPARKLTEFKEPMEPAVQERVARIEAHVEHVQSDVTDIKIEQRRLETKVESNFKTTLWAMGFLLAAIGGGYLHLSERQDRMADRMAQSFERLSERVDHGNARLSERIDQGNARLSERIDQGNARLSERIDQGIARLDQLGVQLQIIAEQLGAKVPPARPRSSDAS